MVSWNNSFLLDLMYIVMGVVLLLASGVLFWHKHPAHALFCFIPVALCGLCIRYRFKVARYYLGRFR